MHTFLGVPIVIRGAVWGNLYLTEKEGGGEFTADDEEAAVILADWAGHGDRERPPLPGQRTPANGARAGAARPGGDARHLDRGRRRDRA
jgi:hypothetical protein